MYFEKYFLFISINIFKETNLLSIQYYAIRNAEIFCLLKLSDILKQDLLIIHSFRFWVCFT